MPAPRQLPSIDVLVKLREMGMSYAAIAEEYGVTKGAVYLQLRDAGRTKSRPDNRHLMPAGGVRTAHQYAHPAMMLRLLGRRERDEAIPPVKGRQLDKWLREMKEAGVVLDYDPACPPNPASKTGRWWYAERTSADGDKLVRYRTQADD